MTTGPTPPPLRQPPPPIPVPVQPLAYTANTPGQGRPGVITALGVVAIVVACLSGLVNFLTFLYGGMFYTFMLPMMAASSPPSAGVTTTVTTVTTGSSAASPAPQQAPQDKLSMADASVAVNTLRSVLDLDGAHTRELDKLVRAHGREVLGAPLDEDDDSQTPGPITDAWLRESIRAHHAASATEPAWFSNKEGRVDIYPDHAVFVSGDGQTIRTSAVHRTDTTETLSAADDGSTSNSTTAPSTQPQGTTLTKTEIRRVMRAVRRASRTPLNPAQTATIEQQLSTPNQAFVTPGTTNPVVTVMQSNNSVYIQFDQGMIDVGPKGQIISMTTGIGATPFSGLPSNVGIVRPPLLLVILEAAGSMAVSVFLLVVGIMVCRSSFSSPRLLRIYAWIKILLACLAGFSIWWLAWRILQVAAASNAVSSGAVPTPSVGPAILWSTTAFFLGIAYPIAVLITLRTRTVREYFNSVSA